MEHRDMVMRIIKTNGQCTEKCYTDDCPFNSGYTHESCLEASDRVRLAQKWLQSNGGTMNKSEALSRLDAIEKEQAELRKIIEKGDKIVYDAEKIYIAMHQGDPHLLTGNCDETCWRFHSFGTGHRSCIGIGDFDTAQEVINKVAQYGYSIYSFSNTREALQFFIDNL